MGYILSSLRDDRTLKRYLLIHHEDFGLKRIALELAYDKRRQSLDDLARDYAIIAHDSTTRDPDATLKNMTVYPVSLLDLNV